jgi:hypothetical protein
VVSGLDASERISFRQVNRATGNRLRQQLVDSVTREPVESHGKGRGYEVAENQFAIVEDQELEKARAEARTRPFGTVSPGATPELRPPSDPEPEMDQPPGRRVSKREDLKPAEKLPDIIPPPRPRIESSGFGSLDGACGEAGHVSKISTSRHARNRGFGSVTAPSHPALENIVAIQRASMDVLWLAIFGPTKPSRLERVQ